MEKNKRVIIIGSGPAGYSAAIYLARANLKPIMISGYEQGGQLTTTTDVENYPGFAKAVQGPWLMEQMKLQAEHVGTEIIMNIVESVDFKSSPFSLTTDDGKKHEAECVIIATGAQAKWLGLETETKFRGFGVSGCATCDGFFFKNQEVMVVGGGNTAVEEALYLTNHASKVTLVHRKNKLRCEKVLEDKLLSHPKIKVIWNTILEEVLGDENPEKSVTGAKLKNVETEEISNIKVSGIFIAIGHKPATEFLKNSGLAMDSEGYIIVKPGTTDTNIEGVFAPGDVSDKIYRQAITAAGTGCISALDAIRFLDK
jgi:thioredoxin reductase (NADPH)